MCWREFGFPKYRLSTTKTEQCSSAAWFWIFQWLQLFQQGWKIRLYFWKSDTKNDCWPPKKPLSTVTVLCCLRARLFGNVALVPHRQTRWVFYLQSAALSSLPLSLSLIRRCCIKSLLPGFEWMLAPLGEHVWLWSLAACSFAATVEERIPVRLDPQTRGGGYYNIRGSAMGGGGGSHEGVDEVNREIIWGSGQNPSVNFTAEVFPSLM